MASACGGSLALMDAGNRVATLRIIIKALRAEVIFFSQLGFAFIYIEPKLEYLWLCRRCAHLLCRGRCRRGPHLKSQPRETCRHPGLQIAHWYSGACGPALTGLCFVVLEMRNLSLPPFFFCPGNRGLPRRHGLQVGRNQQRHHCFAGNVLWLAAYTAFPQPPTIVQNLNMAF